MSASCASLGANRARDSIVVLMCIYRKKTQKKGIALLSHVMGQHFSSKRIFLYLMRSLSRLHFKVTLLCGTSRLGSRKPGTGTGAFYFFFMSRSGVFSYIEPEKTWESRGT